MAFDEKGFYNIKAVENMTGIAAGTLRVWEQRYRVIRPERNRAGYRVYSQEDVQTIQWLAQQVKNGVTIGQAVKMLHQRDSLLPISPILDTGKDIIVDIKERIIKSLNEYDEQSAGFAMEEALSLFSMERVALDITLPILHELGERWARQEITVAQEHFASNFFRARLATMLGALPVNRDRPTVMAACVPNEQHEIGLLIFSIYMRRRGFRVIYLGQNLPVDDLLSSFDELRPLIVALSIGKPESYELLLEFREALLERAEAIDLNLKLAIGGRVIDFSTEKQTEIGNAYPGRSINKWDEWLRNLNK
ncbi:MerR family transcriptional regulator [Heliorestis acidaminivorans]|uniref:MerR family transcriptional regulator n=1 Tax=Heliorestis acidaminivorans TaxID=553427 RepID=A0A6I0ENA5_9FIRM|nr:MerR family transcriptional regulator [Heliorestis acidaminivorans]KAB2951186.1 MerR family transcriptional regulator [Heliorestis acidaminivorans]